MLELTFVIIKPDAIRRGLVGEIISRFEKKKLKITEMSYRWKSKDWVKKHYAKSLILMLEEKKEKIYDFMISGSLLGIILEGENAINVVRQMVGETDSTWAMPGTIRGDYGSLPTYENLVHASDSKETAWKEYKLFEEIK